MGRVNKTIDGVFVKIVGSDDTRPHYDQFMGGSVKDSTKLLTKFEKTYNGLIMKNRKTFEKLGLLETIILQMRVLESPKKIKFSILREYIYARCSFYRNDTVNDIRVIVGNIDVDGTDLVKLSKNKVFMAMTNDKLSEAMIREINKSIEKYKNG